MVTIRADLDKKLEKFFYASIQEPLEEFCSHYACAGITGDEDAAMKARGNHYGMYYLEDGNIKPIPPRQFIWAAVKNINEHGNVSLINAEEINRILVKKINTQPKIRRQETKRPKNIEGLEIVSRRTTQKRTPVIKGDNYDGVFKKLADTMANRLVDAINSRELTSGENSNMVTYNGTLRDIRSNAPSTVKKKHKDHPLVDTGEMRAAIKGWTDAGA